jgi:glycosyltransferase involved in cell wall biosynthesis
MIVLHLDSEKSWRGGEQQVAYLMQELQLKNVTNIVGCPAGSKLEQYCHQNQITCFNVSFGGSQLKAAWQIRNFCKKHKVDIIHMHSAKAHTAGVYSALMGNATNLILSKRTDFPVRNNILSKFKYNYSGIKKILCVSNKIQEVLNESLKDTSKSVTVYSGINPARFNFDKKNDFLRDKFNLSADNILIGNTSALAPHKDYYTFLKTAQLVHEQNDKTHFFLIGNGPLTDELKSYVTKNKMDGYVHFTGFLNNLEEVLPTLDFFLMTSMEEGLGTSLLDSMVCRVPIVATHAGGIPEIVIHQKTGLVAPIGDFKKLSKELLFLIENPSQKEVFVENAYQLATQSFNKKTTAEQTLRIYQQYHR